MQVLLSLALLLSSVSARVLRRDIASDLKALVNGTVSVNLRARWSEAYAPQPHYIVNVTSENDVAAVVKYCVDSNLTFLAQNGGNGWADTFNLGPNGVLINLAYLNAVTFSSDRTQATIGGGATVNDTIQAADAAGALVITANCNCVGVVGALLGGEYGNLLGEVGFGVDNVESFRVVIANGTLLTASSTENTDLFWALRGAGANFGIVTSATTKSIPATAEERTSWIMALTFNSSQVVDVAQAINDLPLTPKQVVYLILQNDGNGNPEVAVTGFLREGTETTGSEAFAPLYALGPLTNTSAVTPYTLWGAGNDGFCTRGDRKPAYSTSIKSMQAEKWTEIWDLYTAFQAKGPNSAVLIERYNLTQAATVANGTTALNDALRKEVFSSAIVIPWYTDASLDAEANEFAQNVRSIWSWSETPEVNPAYINFAHGDEDLVAIYGDNLPRLQTLKKEWDPKNVFNQWFNIQ